MRLLLLSASLALASGAAAQSLPSAAAGLDVLFADGAVLHYAAPDSAVAVALQPVLAAARGDVEAFFGEPFDAPVDVVVAPSRAAFTAVLTERWGVSETACWMVALGVSDLLLVLSPRAWPADACEHDASDAAHLRELVTHELVHVYHGRHNPTGDFDGMDDAGWFVEGVAVLAAGQLTDARLARLRTTVAAGDAPARLADVWSGPNRYGAAGSLVRLVDETYGRAVVVALLADVTPEALLARLDITEEALLARWRAWLMP